MSNSDAVNDENHIIQWMVFPFKCLHTVLFITLRPRQHGRRFVDDVFKCIFLNENVWISLNISLKFVPKVPINNIPVLVQIMAWRRLGDKPLSETMMDNFPTHICVTRPQCVKRNIDTWAIKDMFKVVQNVLLKSGLIHPTVNCS